MCFLYSNSLSLPLHPGSFISYTYSPDSKYSLSAFCSFIFISFFTSFSHSFFFLKDSLTPSRHCISVLHLFPLHLPPPCISTIPPPFHIFSPFLILSSFYSSIFPFLPFYLPSVPSLSPSLSLCVPRSSSSLLSIHFLSRHVKEKIHCVSPYLSALSLFFLILLSLLASPYSRSPILPFFSHGFLFHILPSSLPLYSLPSSPLFLFSSYTVPFSLFSLPAPLPYSPHTLFPSPYSPSLPAPLPILLHCSFLPILPPCLPVHHHHHHHLPIPPPPVRLSL